MNDAIMFGIGLSTVPLGILISKNVYAYMFVKGIAKNGIPTDDLKEYWHSGKRQQATQQQMTAYLDRAPSGLVPSAGYNFARRIYQI